jgi:hypothetical protein
VFFWNWRNSALPRLTASPSAALGVHLAGKRAFEILGDDVPDLHHIAEAQPARILGRRLPGHLQDGDPSALVLS